MTESEQNASGQHKRGPERKIPKRRWFWHIFFPFLIFAAGILFWTVFILFFSPQDVVEELGTANVYATMFLISLFAGLSSITGPALYATAATASLGGANPFFLALLGGAGVLISDGIFYYVAVYGRKVAVYYNREFIDKLTSYTDSLPAWIVYGGSFVYAGMTPFPNDLLIIILALSRRRFGKLAPFLFAGDVLLIGVVAYAARAGFIFFGA